MREAEVVLDVLLRVVALLVADDHHALIADAGQAAEQRVVVAVTAVAAHLGEVVREELEIIERVGPRGVAHDLHALPRREVGVELLAHLLQLLLERLDAGAGIGDVLGKLALSASIFFSISTSGFSNSRGVNFIVFRG